MGVRVTHSEYLTKGSAVTETERQKIARRRRLTLVRLLGIAPVAVVQDAANETEPETSDECGCAEDFRTGSVGHGSCESCGHSTDLHGIYGCEFAASLPAPEPSLLSKTLSWSWDSRSLMSLADVSAAAMDRILSAGQR